MSPFKFAIVSPSSPKDIAGIVTVYAESLNKAKERVKNDNDMQGVRFYPA